MTALRSELPPLPARIRRLPVDGRGYPVPVFVQWFHADKERSWAEPGQGVPDFRVTNSRVLERCLRQSRCWVCGEELGRYKSFVAGSMCAVNRTSAEPPQHHDCATWSAKACPFLARPHAKRRAAGRPVELVKAPGVMLERNPGVTVVWTSRRPSLFRVPEAAVAATGGGPGLLWDMGHPEHVEWWCRGRRATRSEVMESIDSGLPHLEKLAQTQAGGVEELERLLRQCHTLLPPATADV